MSPNSIKPQKITYCRFHRFLFNNMLDGLAELKVVFNQKGEAVDGIFIEVNKAFEKLTGLKRSSIIGERATRVFPGIKNDPAGWLAKYKQAELATKKFHFETFFPKLKRWFSVLAYVPEKGYLTVLFNDITWRVESEKALHSNRRRFEIIFEKSRFAYYEHNVTGEFVMPRWPRLFGYRVQDIKPFKDVEQWFKEKLHSADRRRAETAYKRFINKKATYDLELRVRRRSGDFCWVRVINSAIARDGKGNPKRIGGFIFDITKQKRAEEARLKEKERLKSIIENTQSQLAYFDNQFNFVDANRAYIKDCGYEKEELIGKNHFALFPDNENQATFEKVRDSGKKAEFRAKPFVYKNRPWLGTTYWDWTLTPIRDKSGSVAGLVLSLLNVTERVKQERMLENYARDIERERAEDEALLSSIGDGVIAINTRKKLVFANQAFLKIFRKSLRDFKEKEFHKAFHSYNKFGNPVPYKQRPMIVSLLTGKRVSKDYLDDLGYYAKVGDNLTPLAITASPVILDGKTIGVVGVCRDMTREMEIDRAKDEFLSMAAHQLRTPLTTMSLSLEMILKGFIGKVNKDVRHHLNDFFKDVKTMSQLIKDLLNVSRLDMANLELRIEPHNPVALMNDIIKGFAPQIEKKKLRIKKRYAVGLPLVNTDEKLTTIALENIVSNAVNYTPPKGSVILEIAKMGSKVVIKILDSGWGIPEKEQNRVFEKLFRASNVMSKITGTGLGLYIAKYSLEKCKGKIWFESTEGRGTTFYISLPIAG